MLYERVEKQKSNKPRLKIVSSILFTAMLIIATFTFSTITEAADDEEIIINEIMYNPAGGDPGHEWIEIYNKGATDVNITDWRFYESGHDHFLNHVQGGMEIPAGGYAVIADNDGSFLVDYPDYDGILIDSAFSLSNSGEYIAIKNDALEIVDDTTYVPQAGADDTDMSLEYKEDGIWKVSLNQGGTPGAKNSILFSMLIDKTVCDGEDWVNEKTVNIGDTVRFNISITYNKAVNHGIKLKWITIVDTLPPSLEYDNNATTTETDISDDGRNITWDLTGVELRDMESFYLEFNATVTGCGSHVNKVNVSAFETCPHVQHYAEAEATVNVLCPVIHLDKTVNRTVIHSGDPVAYTYYVNNTGNCNLTNVVVTDDKISSISCISGDTNSNSWLDLSETWIYQATDNPTQDVTNTGNVTAEDELGKKVYYEDSASVDVISPDINVTKTANITEGHVGDVVNYTIVVTNTGTDPLYNVYVNDTTLGISYYITSLASGENKTYYVEHTLTCCPDPFINTVDVEGYDPLGKQYTDEDDATVNVIFNPPNKPDNPSPADEATGIGVNPTLSVYVSDPDGDTMDVYFYNASDDGLIDIATDVVNGTTASVDWPDLNYNTTYGWYAVANDLQLETRSDTWRFTTELEENIAPKVEIIKPERALYIKNRKIRCRFFRMALIIGSITIEANASDEDSGIEKVEFYIDGRLRGTDTTEPYNYIWTRGRLRLFHIHIIKVKAYDNAGNTAVKRMIVRRLL